MSDFSMRDIKTFAEAWQTASLRDEAIAPVLHALDRHDDIGRQSRALKDEAEAAGKELGRKIADGGLTLLEAIAKHAALTSGSTPLGSATGFTRKQVLLDRAQRALRSDVVRFFDGNGVTLVATVIQPAFDKLAGQVRKIAPELVGVGSAEEAAKAGPKKAQAWAKVVDLDRTREALLAAYRALRRCGCDVEVPGILIDFARVVKRVNADTEAVSA